MRHTAVTVFLALGILGVSSPLVVAADGTAKGEATDEKGQQGVGLGSGGGSSNVIMGGPDIIEGKITGIKGDQYSVQGDRGQEISLRVTKDTNLVCAGGQGSTFSTGQHSGKEHQEIAPTPFMEHADGGGVFVTVAAGQLAGWKALSAIPRYKN